MKESCAFRINKINQRKYIDNIELFIITLEKENSCMSVYSPQKELEGDGIKFEQTNENASLISYTIKLANDATCLTKALEIADASIERTYTIEKTQYKKKYF